MYSYKYQFRSFVKGIFFPTKTDNLYQNILVENNVFKGLGAIIAASSVVINNILPYCVVGSVSAKLLKVRWSLEGILKNERIIYPEKSRMSIEFLKNSLYEFL